MEQDDSQISLMNIQHQQLNRIIHLDSFMDMCREMHRRDPLTEEEFKSILDKHGINLPGETLPELFSKVYFCFK